MESKKIFQIRYVAQQTGLTTHLIRVWEKRYQAVVPQRTHTNRRLYSGADIKRLQLLKKVVDAGHSISQVANLSSEELIRLINTDMSDFSKDSYAVESSPLDATYYYRISLTSAVNLDAAGLEKALEQAAVRLTRPNLINNVIVPLYEKIAQLRKQGELKTINEHMATNVIRSLLWDLMRSTRFSKSSPKILITTLQGQPHELGALVMALFACESGWRPLYFGPSLPPEEVAAAIEFTKARAVALSITHATDNHRLDLELKKLRRYLSDDIALLISGLEPPSLAYFFDFDSAGIQMLEDVNRFSVVLDSLLAS